MTITIDTREKMTDYLQEIVNDKILEPRSNDFNFHVLPLSDFLIQRPNGTSICIERKRIDDFRTSLYGESGNGTLKSKLMRMTNIADERAILLEGSYIIDDGTLHIYDENSKSYKISYSQMVNFLYHRQQEGCKVFFTNNLRDTLHLLLILHDDKGGTPSMKVDGWKQFLMLLPGIGKTGAEKIIEKYRTPVEAFMNMNKWPRLGLRGDKW